MPNEIKGGETNTLWLKRRYEQGLFVKSPSGPLSLLEAIKLMYDYYVYEFLLNGKVFYVGKTYHHERSHGRLSFVKNLVENKNRGIISSDTKKKLDIPSNSVIAALTDAGLQEQYSVSVCRPCLEALAEDEEKKQIAKRLSEHCVLANDSDLPPGIQPATVNDVLRNLCVTPKATAATRP